VIVDVIELLIGLMAGFVAIVGGSAARKEGWVKPIASMPQISRASEGWAYDACPRLRG
jgi:hypothetical protein